MCETPRSQTPARGACYDVNVLVELATPVPAAVSVGCGQDSPATCKMFLRLLKRRNLTRLSTGFFLMERPGLLP